MSDIKEDIKQLYQKNGKVNSAIIRRDWFLTSILYKKILEETKFLGEVSISERLYCIEHNIKEKPKCKFCDIYVSKSGFYNVGYAQTCGNKECLNKLDRTNWKTCSKLVKQNNKSRIIKLEEIYSNNKFSLLTTKQIKERLIEHKELLRDNFNFSIKYIVKNIDIIFSILKETEKLIILDFKNIHTLNLSRRIYHVQNDLLEIPKCPVCNNEKAFYNRKVGYSSITCGNIECYKKYAGENIALNKQKITIPHIENNNKDYVVLNCNNLTNLEILHKNCNKTFEVALNNARWKDKVLFCPFCYVRNQPESAIQDFLLRYDIKFIKNDRAVLKPLELDIYIPENKLAIEFDGLYWHSYCRDVKNKNKHLYKTEECLKQNIKLIHIFEDEWINKQRIVQNRIKHALNLSKYRIGAREVEIREIDSKLKDKFLEKYHIQGKDKSSIRLGAFYKNRLVGVMTFGKLRKALGNTDKTGSFELYRFCTMGSLFSFPGLFSRMLANFKVNHFCKEIITYADRRWSNGEVYKKNGFVLDHISPPNYWYFKNSLDRMHRFNFRKDVLKDKLEKYDESKSEWTNMNENGWNKIYDCGNLVFKHFQS